MSEECCFKIGDLVEYRSWYDGESGWFSINQMIGVVLEIIEISPLEVEPVFPEYNTIYDIRVYWYTEQVSEIVPDLLLDHFVIKIGERL